MIKENEKYVQPESIKSTLILLFDPKYKKPKVDPDSKNLFSVDVLVIDENGESGIAYYNFDYKIWGFHSNTLGQYDKGSKVKWLWYYPPVSENDLEF